MTTFDAILNEDQYTNLYYDFYVPAWRNLGEAHDFRFEVWLKDNIPGFIELVSPFAQLADLESPEDEPDPIFKFSSEKARADFLKEHGTDREFPGIPKSSLL